ncbi:hypothetical protein BPOR_2328g00020 [Botrytis porri]|uniref:Uncharacterized protein n=1 Tax=Botrytis porri TaxID=87229 RepID=A0A4Z1JVT6_9HELO|nr:hypothetical protein BPOR_2328g00020 [Botrytis porri]
MYSDGNGNVNISARAGGQGHVEPKVTGGPGSQVQLLEGSGIIEGVMGANVLFVSKLREQSDNIDTWNSINSQFSVS